MAILTFQNTTLCIVGEGFIDFDDQNHPEILIRAIKSHRDPYLCIPIIYPIFTETAKRIFHQVVDNNDDLELWFTDLCRNHANLTSPTGTWNEEDLTIVWRCLVRTWLLEEILIDSEGRTFVRTRWGTLLTEVELRDHHNCSIDGHFQEFIDSLTFIRAEIGRATRGTIAEKPMMAVTPEQTITTITLRGPSTIPWHQWQVPPGYTLLDDEDLSANP